MSSPLNPFSYSFNLSLLRIIFQFYYKISISISCIPAFDTKMRLHQTLKRFSFIVHCNCFLQNINFSLSHATAAFSGPISTVDGGHIDLGWWQKEYSEVLLADYFQISLPSLLRHWRLCLLPTLSLWVFRGLESKP